MDWLQITSGMCGNILETKGFVQRDLSSQKTAVREEAKFYTQVYQSLEQSTNETQPSNYWSSVILLFSMFMYQYQVVTTL